MSLSARPPNKRAPWRPIKVKTPLAPAGGCGWLLHVVQHRAGLPLPQQPQYQLHQSHLGRHPALDEYKNTSSESPSMNSRRGPPISPVANSTDVTCIQFIRRNLHERELREISSLGVWFNVHKLHSIARHNFWVQQVYRDVVRETRLHIREE
jgi:hypothetical protein